MKGLWKAIRSTLITILLGLSLGLLIRPLGFHVTSDVLNDEWAPLTFVWTIMVFGLIIIIIDRRIR